MNRIQQILSKAERDGTARRLETVEHVSTLEAPAPAPPRRSSSFVDPGPVAPEEIEPVSYAAPSSTAVAVDARLDPMLVAALKPLSVAAEQYRTLRGRIAQAENGHGLRVIQVSSPGRRDGKTVTALNLALTMAREFQRRVLILDADLRQPGVHALLGVTPGPGLVDVLTGTATLDQALIEIPDHHLTVLRAGATYERPAEMLGSAPMRRLIDTLRTQFDRVVVDSPAAEVSDPGALGPLVDGLVLVVRASMTTKPAISQAVAALASPKLLGLVFNESNAPVQGTAA